MNNFLVAIAVFVIAVFAAAFAAPRLIHWETYRGVIEEEATRLLGRDVRVSGGVRIRLLPSPTFSIEKIRIADTEANTGEPFFQAEALRGRLSIAPLLRGALQVSDVVLQKPLLHLVLNDQGGGNWKNFGSGAGQLPFQLSEVALDNVKIVGGSLGIFGTDRAERLRIDSIDGVLSAQALDGPFRFRGTYGADPQKRELRVSTSRQEADGSIRFKAALQHADTGASYNFDARAVDLAKAPRVEGELSAKVALPTLTGPQAGQPSSQPPAAKGDQDALVEVKAAMSADLKQVKLANLSLAFERNGRPQILTGDATIDLTRAVTLDASLAAKWLDLDQVIGAAPVPGLEASFKPSRSPVESLLSLAQRLNGFTLEQGETRLSLDVEQANLGREAVNGLRLTLQGKGAETDIRELRLGLPGGAQADIKGLMTGSGEETSFSGDIVLRGTSLTRFLSWSTAGATLLDPARDGTFAMRARLDASPGTIVAREFTGELAGTLMQGELGYRWQGRPEVSVLIEGPRVDLRTVVAADPSGRPQSLAAYLAAGSTFGAQAGKTDAKLRVRAGELLLPGATFIDAEVDLEVRSGRVSVSRLRLAADHGVTLDVEGELPPLGTTDGGTLRGTVSAETVDGARALASLLALPPSALPDAASFPALVPLRLAGQLTFSTDPGSRIDFAMDGDAAGTRIAAKGWFARGFADWQSGPADIAAQFAGPRALSHAKLMTGRIAPAAPSVAEPLLGDGATVVVHLAGTARAGLVAEASVSDSDQQLSFSGRATPGTAQGLHLTGDLRVAGTSADTILALLTGRRSTVPPIAVDGRARIDTTQGRLRLDGITASVGGSRVGGQLAIDLVEGAITGRLAVAELHATALLTPLLDQRASSPPSVTPWSTRAFDDKAIANMSADIVIDADRLMLPTSAASLVALDKATFQLALRPARVEIRDLSGQASGGLWTGAARVDASKDGGTLTLAMRVKDLRTAQFKRTSTGVPAIDTSLTGALTLSGRGTNPHDMIASASGRGTLALSATRLAVLSPTDLTALLQGALKSTSEPWVEAFRRQLASSSPKTLPFPLPARALDIDVRNGVAIVSPFGIETADGKALASASIDLSAMAVAATWRLEVIGDVLPSQPGWTATVTPSGGLGARKSAVPLPPMITTWTAPIAGFERARTDHATEALEREVAVRKVERDLEDLERLRRLDEERGKEEAERRRALEAGIASGTPIASPQPTAPPASALDAATDATAVPDTVDPALRPRAAPAAAAAPAPKPAYRPLSSDEQREIFNR